MKNRFTITITTSGNGKPTHSMSFTYTKWGNVKGLLRNYPKVAQFDNIEVVDNATGELLVNTAENYISTPYGC